MDLIERLEAFRNQEKGLHWEGTFADYFQIATKNPAVARLSHARIYDMIVSAGTTQTATGEPHHMFFDHEIFGLSGRCSRLRSTSTSRGSGSRCASASCCSWGRSAAENPPSSAC